MSRGKTEGGLPKAEIARLRREHIDNIREGDYTRVIHLRGYAEALGYGMLDDVWDEDGDGIGAVSEDAFLPDGHPIVNVEFPQGTDPQVVSRMLHKMARVLEGASRHQIANMQPADQARRIGDGEVDIVNLRELFKEYREDDAAQG